MWAPGHKEAPNQPGALNFREKGIFKLALKDGCKFDRKGG